MANNRLYLTCKECGSSILLGKHFAGALHTSVTTIDDLNDFYLEHCYCSPSVHYNLALTEEFEGEMVYNAVKINRMKEIPCVECSECGGKSPVDALYCMICGALFIGNTIKDTPDI